MPFGENCEHADFDACVRAMTGKVDDPRAFCGALMRRTEERCRAKAVAGDEIARSIGIALAKVLSESIVAAALKFLKANASHGAGWRERLKWAQREPKEIQTILFDPARFGTAEEVRAWLDRNDFRSSDVEKPEGEGSQWRARQFPPGRCEDGTYATFELDDGVQATLCALRKSRGPGAAVFDPRRLESSRPRRYQVLASSGKVQLRLESGSGRGWVAFDLVDAGAVLKAGKRKGKDRESALANSLLRGGVVHAGDRRSREPGDDGGLESLASGKYVVQSPPDRLGRFVRFTTGGLGGVDLNLEALRGARADRAGGGGAEAGRRVRYALVEKQDEKRFTLGVAYPAREVDAHGEFASEDEVEKAAWGYLARGGKIGLHHADGTEGSGQVVESYIWRGQSWERDGQVVGKGDWLVGAVWGEEAWQLIKSGRVTGFSIQGFAARAPGADEE